ncbi:hypothetical protein J2T07_000308 [Luteibacter jiangsuensis]|uniref:Uncharacterized protein n=1 Tax=Luteibacter jiangsuensis TaxID=637577 RepID=A0ABT9ST36_9GAMM|nr:hypothetical protein [Luteibacter jiangsuensis]MDQ0008149.1 hypothetical protein [Luteibacter jiangsuensis]
MTNNASQFHDASTKARAFARLSAFEVTAVSEDDKGGLFLTIYTDPDRPEPEIGIIGG